MRTYGTSCRSAAAATAGVLLAGAALAAGPHWWTHRGVIDPDAGQADYAPVVLGQLKWMATNAYVELKTNLHNGAGNDIGTLVTSFSTWDNWRSVTVGQLKNVASNVYDRLIAESNDTGITSYPWTAVTTDDVDQAVANIGQLKNLFSFDLDTDADLLPDWWEIDKVGSLTNLTSATADDDDDGPDGLTNREEYEHGTHPLDSDSDDDTIDDGTEVANRTDPNNDDTNAPVVWIVYPSNNSEWIWMP